MYLVCMQMRPEEDTEFFDLLPSTSFLRNKSMTELGV